LVVHKPLFRSLRDHQGTMCVGLSFQSGSSVHVRRSAQGRVDSPMSKNVTWIPIHAKESAELQSTLQ
jgi:hypothetical protein